MRGNRLAEAITAAEIEIEREGHDSVEGSVTITIQERGGIIMELAS